MLTDSFGRHHNYLRISLTEQCNLRCTYCMPAEGVALTPKAHLMTSHEIFTIAQKFVAAGVTKIRLTGGEPLIRKDAQDILEKLATLNVELAITTNAVISDRFIELFKKTGMNNINVSLDTLIPERFKTITRRNYFQRVYDNIFKLVSEGFNVKLNCVLMKGINEDEIIDFIHLSKEHDIQVRFIEFMPFDGNNWDRSKLVSFQEIMTYAERAFSKEDILRINDRPNDTSKNYQIKNCLFSSSETDLLTALRKNEPIEPLIAQAIKAKLKMRGGMDTPEKFQDPSQYEKNRSMITIGG